MDDVVVYGRNSGGGHHVGTVVDGLRVLVSSDSEGTDERAVRLAEAIRDAGHEREVAARDLRACNEHRRRLSAERDGARHALQAAIAGRRRFNGPVLLVPAMAGDWSGAVWLQDPEKRDRGFGLRFESLAEVREAHPELWVVGMNEHGVLLDAAVLPTARDSEEDDA